MPTDAAQLPAELEAPPASAEGAPPPTPLSPAEPVPANGAAATASDAFATIEAPEEPSPATPLPGSRFQYAGTAPIPPPAPDELDEAARDALLQSILSDETIDLEIGGTEDPAAQFDPAVQETLRRVTKTDVNAHSLGVIVTRTLGGRGKSILIPRNTPLPAGYTKIYGTMKPNQPEVVIRIIEGESEYPDDCHQLGVCKITGLPPDLPKGSPVEVTFTLDDSGRLHVRAVEQTSGQFVTTTIECDSGMSRERIDRARGALENVSVV
jgi:hypothetical protein